MYKRQSTVQAIANKLKDVQTIVFLKIISFQSYFLMNFVNKTRDTFVFKQRYDKTPSNNNRTRFVNIIRVTIS